MTKKLAAELQVDFPRSSASIASVPHFQNRIISTRIDNIRFMLVEGTDPSFVFMSVDF